MDLSRVWLLFVMSSRARLWLADRPANDTTRFRWCHNGFTITTRVIRPSIQFLIWLLLCWIVFVCLLICLFLLIVSYQMEGKENTEHFTGRYLHSFLFGTDRLLGFFFFLFFFFFRLLSIEVAYASGWQLRQQKKKKKEKEGRILTQQHQHHIKMLRNNVTWTCGRGTGGCINQNEKWAFFSFFLSLKYSLFIQ